MFRHSVSWCAYCCCSAPDDHPYSPYPGGGGDSVGAASEREKEREIADQVVKAVQHSLHRLKSGLKVRAKTLHTTTDRRITGLYRNIVACTVCLVQTCFAYRCCTLTLFGDADANALKLASEHAQRQTQDEGSSRATHIMLPGEGLPLSPVELELLDCFEAYETNSNHDH